MNKKREVCIFCESNALYRHEDHQAYCEKCYWELEEKKERARHRSWKTYSGRNQVESTTYIKCPHCGMSDTCGTDGCITQCKQCGLYGKRNCLKLRTKKTKRHPKEQQEVKQHDQWAKIAEEIYSLLQKNRRDFEDYQQIKKLQKETDTLLKEVKDDNPLKELLKECQKSLENLEKETPWKEYSKCLHNGESATNFPVSYDDTSIQWSGKKDEEPYCIDCGTSNDNSERFLRAFCRLCKRIIQEWLNLNKINHISDTPLSSESKQLYLNLIHGGKYSCVSYIKEAYWKIEKEIDKFADERNLDIISKGNIERERKQNRTQQSTLRTQITQLESKPAKTPSEEAELARKKKELKDLEEKLKELEQQNQSAQSSLSQKPWGLIVGGGALAVVGLVGLAIVIKFKKKKH